MLCLVAGRPFIGIKKSCGYGCGGSRKNETISRRERMLKSNQAQTKAVPNQPKNERSIGHDA